MKLPNNPISQQPDLPTTRSPNDLKAQLPNSLSVVFFGSSKYVIPIIEVLKKDFDLALVVTTERNSSDPIPSYCLAQKIPYLSVSSSSDLIHNSSFIIHHSFSGVVADFGLIIPKEILDLFPKGTLNVHPSLLPKYRGPTPAQNAILNGDQKTGVTIIKLDNEIDHGPILTQKEIAISSSDNAQTLYEKLFRIGADLLHQNLNKYIKGAIKLSEQDHSKATFTKILTREDGRIDLSSLKISNLKLKIDRMIRAYYPWPGAWTELRIRNHELRIKFLPDKKIQVEGKKPMSYKDFLNGYPEAKELLKHI